MIKFTRQKGKCTTYIRSKKKDGFNHIKKRGKGILELRMNTSCTTE